MEDGNKTLDAVRSVLFKESETLEGKNFPRINGYDFNKGVDLAGLIFSMASTGFQASNLGDAIQVVNQMIGGCLMKNQLKIAVRRRGIQATESL